MKGIASLNTLFPSDPLLNPAHPNIRLPNVPAAAAPMTPPTSPITAASRQLSFSTRHTVPAIWRHIGDSGLGSFSDILPPD
jgi:hypothetical protein